MIERFIHYKPRRITAFVGAYGSGKSEVSVNFAIWLAKKKKTYLADLDMINPFYRSADTAKTLADNNVELIKSIYAGTNVDVPAMPAEINRTFSDDLAYSVLDIGGEDLGARVLGSLKPQMEKADCDLLLVVNPYRPFTDTPEKIAKTALEIEHSSGLRLTGIVHNPNLLEFSDTLIIEESWEIVRAAADVCNLPIAFISVMEEKIDYLWQFNQPEIPVLAMHRTIFYPSDDR